MEDNLERIGHNMMLAWARIKKAQARMWGDWMTIGEGLMEGRRWAMQMASTNRPEGKGYVTAFGKWLKRYRVDDMDKSDRAKLLQLMEERPAVEEWRATLPDYERRSLNNPIIVWRKWTAATRVKKPRQRTASVSASEHGRAQAIIEQLQARNAELEAELASERTRHKMLEVQHPDGEDWALFVQAARPFLHSLEHQGRSSAVAAAPAIVLRDATQFGQLIEHWPTLSAELKQQLAKAKNPGSLLSPYITKSKDERALAEGLVWRVNGGVHRADFGAGGYNIRKAYKGEDYIACWKHSGDSGRGDIIAEVRTLEAAKAACEQHMREPD